MGWPLASDFQTIVTRAPGLSSGSRARPTGSNCQVCVSPSTSRNVIAPAVASTETTWTCVWLYRSATSVFGDALVRGRIGGPRRLPGGPGDALGEGLMTGVSTGRPPGSSGAARAEHAARTRATKRHLFFISTAVYSRPVGKPRAGPVDWRVPRDRPMPPVPPPLRVAIVGAGSMAREHARAFAAVPGITVAGIHSRTRPRAEALARELGIPHVCDSLGELHGRTEAGLAVLAVSEPAMKAVALAALDFPWTLLLEKPPGLVPEETEEIAGVARRRSRDVRVALNRQWIGSTQAAIQGLREHDGPRFVKVQDEQSLAQAAAIGHPPDVVRNWMFANSIHLVDYFRYLARGEVRRVDHLQPWKGEQTDVLLARLEFTSGDVGLYEAIWHAPGPWAVTVTVPRRRWELRPLEQLTTQVLGERPVAVPPGVWDAEFKPGFRLQAQHAAEAARGGASPLPTIGDALRTMRLVRALYPA